jgi:hypothetical protein
MLPYKEHSQPLDWFDYFDWFSRLTTKRLSTKRLTIEGNWVDEGGNDGNMEAMN